MKDDTETQQRAPYSPRWGRWRISGPMFAMARDAMFHDEWERFAHLTAYQREVFIVRAQDSPRGDFVEYTGISRHFDALTEGEEIPEYTFEFFQEPDGGELCIKALRARDGIPLSYEVKP